MERGHESARNPEAGKDEMKKALGTFDGLRELAGKSLLVRSLAGLAIISTLEACGQFSEEMAVRTKVAGVGFELKANPNVDEAKHGRLGGMIEIVGTADGGR